MRKLFYAAIFVLTASLFVPTSASFAQDKPLDDPFSPDAISRDWLPGRASELAADCRHDRIMPSAARRNTASVEALNTFGAPRLAGAALDINASGERDPGVYVTVEQQDYSALTYGASCVGNAFNVGGQEFKHGLGVHANSRVRVDCPEPIARFKAKAGLNTDCAGSVQFAVSNVRLLADAQDGWLWRSDTIKSAAPVDVDVAFDKDVRSFYLYAFTTDDGPASDQANWIDPVAVGVSGKEYRIAEVGVTPRLAYEQPFSFTYGGRSSREFLKDWKFTFKTPQNGDGILAFEWTDPDTDLIVTAVVNAHTERYACFDWILTFENRGAKETPLIENVKPLDASLWFGVDLKPLCVGTLSGDSCDAGSWAPVQHKLEVGKELAFAPRGGRSSDGAFPFWNITPREVDGNETTDGVFFAIGWSGQWNAKFSRPKEQQTYLRAEAGMETFASVLRPGEKIRTPRVLYMPWNGTRVESQVLFRRALMDLYAPHVDGKPIQMEFVEQCFDRYYRKRSGWEKCGAQIESAKKLQEIGGTAYWFDAAWFPVGFPNGVGNWFSDKTNFPNGVEELGNALKDMNLRFILWFEPERVAKGSYIAEKLPDFVFGGKEGGLFKLNDPEARKFLTETLLTRVKEFKIDVYRNDFNISPYQYWIAADEPNRKGMTETRYVEGLYEMWDALREANPGLWIDNCASGGRRIDLETLMRSVPLWRSDTCCWPDHPEWDQSHTIGLAQFLPLFSCSSWSSDPYTFRSAANPGAIMQYNFLDEDYDRERAKISLDEAKTYQKFWYGDFYPLTNAPVGKSSTVAWQLHRADLEAGLIYIFRQPESRYPMVELEPYAIDPDAKYSVRVRYGYDKGEWQTMLGKELFEIAPILKERKSVCVVEYKKNAD